MVYDARNESGPPDGSGGGGGGTQAPEPAPPETTPDAPARRQRGRNMPNNPNVSMGPSGRQELNIRGKRYIRDGSWWVDADALGPYGDDPDAAPPELVERSRMPYAQGLNKARRLNVAAYNDANWQGEAQAAGYGDWRESRRAAMQAFQADPVKFWQMAGNGGGGDLTKQPTPDDLERFGHWLWITNPANQQEVMAAYKGTSPTATPPPPTTDRQPPTDPPQPAPNAEKIVNGILYRQQPDGTWLRLGPAPTGGGQTTPGTPPQTTRPPQPAGAPVVDTAPNTGMGQPLVQPTLSRMNMGKMPSVRPDAWWKGTGGAGGAADSMPQLGQMPGQTGVMKPFTPKAPAATSLTTPKPTFGGIKLK